MSVHQGGLGGRPAGFGRPGGDPSGSATTSTTNSYLARLMGTVAINQRAAQGSNNSDPSAGFQSYSYNKGRGAGVFNGLFATEEGVMSDEEYRLEVIEQAAYKGTELYSMLHNRHGRFYSAVKAALDYFPKPEQAAPRDPVVGEFIDEVLSNLSLYRYCCSYACILFSATIADYALAGRTEELVKNERTQHDAVFNNFVNVLGMQFLSWLEFHPEAITMQNRLLPNMRARIEKFENTIDSIHGMILSVSVGSMQVPFPWKKGALKRIMEKSHAGAPVYEISTMYKDSADTSNTLWGRPTGTESSAGQSAPDDGLPSWMRSYMERQENINVDTHMAPKTQPFEFDNQSVNTDSWANENLGVGRKDRKLIELAKKVTRSNRLDFNPNRWFKPIPGTDQFVIDPDHFMYIADAMEYDGEGPDYGRSGWLSVGCIPVVRFDWARGIYTYENIYVGEDNVGLMLTNPEEVIPKLNADNEDVIMASFDQYIAEVNDVVKTTELSEAHTECKEIKNDPKVIYGNAPIEIDTNEDVIKAVRDVSALVEKRMNRNPDVLVLPMVSRKSVTIDDVDFNYSMIQQKLPFLITGYEIAMDGEEFFATVRRKLQSIGSRELTNIVSNHLTNVVNRWLVECRFYSDNKEDPNYLALENVLEDFNDFIGKAKIYDPSTGRALYKLCDDEFLCENITLFASKETQEKYIAKATNSIEDEVLRDARKVTLEKSVLLEKQYAFARVNPMEPLDYVGRVIIEGSHIPEMRWLMDNVPDYLAKHFNRRVPLVIGFGKDSSPRIWSVTRSNFCESKFSLRRLSLNSPLPLFKLMS